MQAYNRTALITGATSGIGLELAKLFAKDNYNLVIVARNEESLGRVAVELNNLGAGKITVIAQDLSIAGAAAEVYKITSEQNIAINVLVNDAGVGERGLFSETNLEKELAIIQLNVSSLVHLTKLYLKDMLKRNEGRIMQVASISAYQPTPLLAVYAATKAFVLSFTDALINELQDTKVTMTALIPGATDTDFFKKAGAEYTKAAMENPEDPEIVAQYGYDALMKGEHHALAPGVRSQILMSTVMPNENVAAMAREQMEDPRIKPNLIK